MDPASEKPATGALAATSRALLCMMSYEEEISGYDLKKWIDWSVDLYYWSPSYSQIYTELKKLEGLGLVTSRVERDEGTRTRRLYKITQAGMDAAIEWVNDAPVDPPVLKHSVLLRVTFGHLTNPARLKELLQEHVAFAEARHRKAVEDADGAEGEPAWAYSVIALRSAAKIYAAEREFALELMKDIDEADAIMKRPPRAALGSRARHRATGARLSSRSKLSARPTNRWHLPRRGPRCSRTPGPARSSRRLRDTSRRMRWRPYCRSRTARR